MLKVIDVDYVKDYELLLTFNDGTRKLVDLRPYKQPHLRLPHSLSRNNRCVCLQQMFQGSDPL